MIAGSERDIIMAEVEKVSKGFSLSGTRNFLAHIFIEQVSKKLPEMEITKIEAVVHELFDN